MTKEKANLLAGLFAANSHLLSLSTPQPLPELERISVVKRVLADLNVNKSSGPDNIPALVLKQCFLKLAHPLAKLFCLSYRAGIFLLCLKLANVTPIPKNGKVNNPKNYRPIAVCSALSKVVMINHTLHPTVC